MTELQRSSAAQVSRIFILSLALDYQAVYSLKFRITYHRLAAHDQFPLMIYALRNIHKPVPVMAHHLTYLAVSASYRFLKAAVLICKNQSKTVQFP